MKSINIWDDDIQGSSKIKQVRLLVFSLPKSLLATSAVLLSGLVLVAFLIRFPGLVAQLFYRAADEEEQATHVLIQGQDGYAVIEKIKNTTLELSYFQFLKVPYKLDGSLLSPFNGNLVPMSNRHNLDPPDPLDIGLKMLFSPLFIYQILAVVVYFVQGFFISGFSLLALSIISIAVNIITILFNYNKLKQQFQKVYPVTVLRDKELQIQNIDLLFGDLWLPRKGQIVPCDCQVIEGQLYVDESNLTGQNIPVFKTFCKDGKLSKSNKIYEGSMVIDSSQAKCMVVLTGFFSFKGRIIRTRLVENNDPPKFYYTSFVYYSIYMGIGFIALFSNYSVFLRLGTTNTFYRFFDCVNQLLPSYIGIMYSFLLSFHLYQLRKQSIITTTPKKIVEAGQIAVMCFDKTGTLTSNQIRFDRTWLREGEQVVGNGSGLPLRLRQCMSLCHQCVYLQSKLQGQEIELEGIKQSGFLYDFNSKRFYNPDQRTLTYTLLRRFSFDSYLKRMSVVVRLASPQSTKYFLFVKGAPDVLAQKGVSKKGEASVQRAVIYSKLGKRSISYYCRQLKEQQISMERSQLQEGLQFLGLIAFSNDVKPESKTTIESLHRAGISTKIISGDQLNLVVQVGKQVGIINQAQQEQNKSSETCKRIVEKCQYLDCRDHSCSSKECSGLECKSVSTLPDQHFSKIKIFARATPKDKAFIVARLSKIYNPKSDFFSDFTQARLNVGMVGDGANDILAINCADVGVGLSGCQSSLGASFSINQIDKLQLLISQGRSSISSVFDSIRFLVGRNFLSVTLVILMSYQSSYFSDFALNWYYYVNKLNYLVFLMLSRGTVPLRAVRVELVFFDWKLVVFNVMSSVGIIGTVLAAYFMSEDIKGPVNFASYMQNSKFISTIQIYAFFFTPLFAVAAFQGPPYKAPFYLNIGLLLMSLINLILGLLIPLAGVLRDSLMGSSYSMYCFWVGLVGGVSGALVGWLSFKIVYC